LKQPPSYLRYLLVVIGVVSFDYVTVYVVEYISVIEYASLCASSV